MELGFSNGNMEKNLKTINTHISPSGVYMVLEGIPKCDRNTCSNNYRALDKDCAWSKRLFGKEIMIQSCEDSSSKTKPISRGSRSMHSMMGLTINIEVMSLWHQVYVTCVKFWFAFYF